MTDNLTEWLLTPIYFDDFVLDAGILVNELSYQFDSHDMYSSIILLIALSNHTRTDFDLQKDCKIK